MRAVTSITAHWRSLAGPRVLTVRRFTTKDCVKGRYIMARGDKDSYTDKQKRKAEHIADSYGERGVPKKAAKARAWATVNKDSGGGNKSGSGRGKPDTTTAAKAGARKGGRKTTAKQAAKRSAKPTAKKSAKPTVNAKKAAKKSSMGARHEQRSAAAKKGWETRRKRSGTKAKVRKTTARKSTSR